MSPPAKIFGLLVWCLNCDCSGATTRPWLGLDLELLEPGRRARAETEGDQHGLGRDDFLGARNRLGATAATGIRLAETGLDHLDAFHLAVADDGDGLAVEEELDALFLGVFHFLA